MARSPGYSLAAYREGREIQRQALEFLPNPTNYSFSGASAVAGVPRLFATVSLASIPTEIAILARCDHADVEIARQAVTWPVFEAEAVARPDRRINPVDLGTVLVPHDWLLLRGGQATVISATALSRGNDLPTARLRAWFTGGPAVEVDFPLVANQKAAKEFEVTSSPLGDRATLHVRIVEGEREWWGKDIHVLNVRKPPIWPKFGAVETKLRYDAPIVVADPEVGTIQPPIDYDTAWDQNLRDVVVFLPNGSRFVFWRGSSYVPFWAGTYNTGVTYQWAETSVPVSERDRGAKDFLLEPLFDKELRYGRVHIVESTQSRVHVRWRYQLPDYRNKVWGNEAVEDFYFYPDGFGTRALTASARIGTYWQVSEFIVLTPQAAYPLQVLPRRMLEVISLDGRKGGVNFPVDSPLKPDGPISPDVGYGAELRRWEPTILRIFPHKDDPASAVYFHPRDSSPLIFFPPLYDQGELATPAYWGNHWPLSRGGWTGWSINDRISVTPSHNSIASPIDFPVPGYEPKPDLYEWVSQGGGLDALGHPREVTTRHWAWMIAMTDLLDAELIDWAKSYSAPPTVSVIGARLDSPAYVPERRAMRLIADASMIEIKIKPQARTVNPVFEIGRARGRSITVTLNGRELAPEAYTWDGMVLWIRATIGDEGAVIGVQSR